MAGFDGVIGLAVSGTVGGNAMAWHFRLGYSVLALLLFRSVWGLVSDDAMLIFMLCAGLAYWVSTLEAGAF